MSVLHARSITKLFPGVRALSEVSLEVSDGEVHCLLGENGAGKSTLIKIISGALQPDSGEILYKGAPVRFASPFDALHAGIATIFQDSNLVPELSVAENILLGREPRRSGLPLLDRPAMRAEARRALELVGESIDPDIPARDLTPAQHQMVEIAKALARNAALVIMDEPTAALTDRETQNLFTVIRKIAADGIGVTYISHRLEEIFAIGHRITVLRDGSVVGTVPVAQTNHDQLVRMMVGRDVPPSTAPQSPSGSREILRVSGLTSDEVSECSFTLHEGEILGIAGLAGSGRSELARCLFGADERRSGTVALHGTAISPASPADAIDLGIGFLTEDRNRLGLFLQRSIRENISISNLGEYSRWQMLDKQREGTEATALATRFGVKYADLEFSVDTLSGGNRQKVLLARWLAVRPKVLIFDEPTAGIDVGAKSEIHTLMKDLAREGVGVIVISSDLPELLGLASRILVMRDRTTAGVLSASEANEESIMRLCMS